MQKLILVILSLISLNAAAEGSAMDSDQISPPDITTGKNHGYVLTTGSASFNCKGGKGYQCQNWIYYVCAKGYTPSIMIGVAGTGSNSRGIKMIYLDPPNGILSPANSSYQLSFNYAYTQPTSGNTSSVKINYTVYCG